MIATPSLSETCEYKSNFRSSPDPDSVTKQSDQSKRVSNYDPKSHADTNSESANQNFKQIDRYHNIGHSCGKRCQQDFKRPDFLCFDPPVIWAVSPSIWISYHYTHSKKYSRPV
jgi:hypothetical protein